jgi:hypothetical protein
MPSRFEIPESGYTRSGTEGNHSWVTGAWRRELDVGFSQIALKTTAATVGIAAAGILAATPAFADPEALQFGQMAEIPNPGGAIEYTVSTLQPSGHNDGIWYSDVTAQAVSGFPTPNISDFNARAVNSSTYADMKGNETDGLPNQPITVGSQTTGRIYFDVRGGTAPNSVVYRDAGGTDKVVWTD